jgi:hypothetical protein
LLPNLLGNNVIFVEEHIDTFYVVFQNFPLNNEDEDVVMEIFATSLVENARKWYNNLPDKSINNSKYFHDRWGKKDGMLLLVQFNEMKQKGNESVKEFDTRFDNLLKKFMMTLVQRMVFPFSNIPMHLKGNMDSCLGTRPHRPLQNHKNML